MTKHEGKNRSPNDKTSINGALRISGFVILSSFDIRASSFFEGRAAIATFSSTISFHRNWFPEFVNRNESKHAVGDAKPLAGHITRYPYLHRDGHRGPPDFLHPRITSDRVAYPHRL